MTWEGRSHRSLWWSDQGSQGRYSHGGVWHWGGEPCQGWEEGNRERQSGIYKPWGRRGLCVCVCVSLYAYWLCSRCVGRFQAQKVCVCVCVSPYCSMLSDAKESDGQQDAVNKSWEVLTLQVEHLFCERRDENPTVLSLLRVTELMLSYNVTFSPGQTRRKGNRFKMLCSMTEKHQFVWNHNPMWLKGWLIYTNKANMEISWSSF